MSAVFLLLAASGELQNCARATTLGESLRLSGGGFGLPPRDSLSARDAEALTRRAALAAIGGALPLTASIINECRRITEATQHESVSSATFKRVPKLFSTEFIAALGEPGASSGSGAERWGLWRDDPGPQGVLLRDYTDKLVRTEGRAPAGWQLDDDAFWLEEYGRIMPGTQALPCGKYVVSGDREVTSVLTVTAEGGWQLSRGTLADVTHLPCRSALYTPADPAKPGSCSPAAADQTQFRVKPGAPMPAVPGCSKQDYAVLFVIGFAT